MAHTKKLLVFLLIIFASSTLSGYYSNESVAENNKTEYRRKKGKVGKDGRYKRRRGLFGKKSACDCPEH
jgi:hypothetical protein